MTGRIEEMLTAVAEGRLPDTVLYEESTAFANALISLATALFVKYELIPETSEPESPNPRLR